MPRERAILSFSRQIKEVSMKGFLTVIWFTILLPFIILGFVWGFVKMGIDVGVSVAAALDKKIAKLMEW